MEKTKVIILVAFMLLGCKKGNEVPVIVEQPDNTLTIIQANELQQSSDTLILNDKFKIRYRIVGKGVVIFKHLNGEIIKTVDTNFQEHEGKIKIR
jgi:hypothetical protein